MPGMMCNLSKGEEGKGKRKKRKGKRDLKKRSYCKIKCE